VEKHKHRCDTVIHYAETQNTFVQVNLISFASYLKQKQLHQFSRWFLLNNCVREENPNGLSLQDMARDDVIFQSLSKYFSTSFLEVNEKEKKNLALKKLAFLKFLKTHALIA
jgi:hypothetical protein